MSHSLRVAIITTDARHWLREFETEIPNFGAAIRALLQGFEELPEVEIHVISASPRPLRSRQKLAANMEFHHVHVAKWGWGKGLFLGVACKVRKLIQRIQPDIVHGQGTERDCAIAAVLSGCPNVLTIHGNMQELQRMGLHGHPIYGRLVSILETFALAQASGVFCNSRYTQEIVAPRAKKTWRVPNAIRAEFFQPGTNVAKRPTPTLVNVGLVGPRKRQLELLRLLGEVVKSGRQLHVVFAGSLAETSEYGAAFAAELRKAETAGYATFVGFLDMPELIRLLDSSHAFLHFPSEEAFGLVVAEAIARGLKFFGANLGGIADIASGIDGAELHDDFESLRTGITRWLDAGATAPMLAADEIAKRYHPKVIAERHVEIYREVLGR
jgi:glycosyltransferase involved in cell wall biosynthesis